jgi:gliding motility-associated-like protein
MKKIIFLVVFVLLGIINCFQCLHAQLTIDNTKTALQIAQSIAGPGVTVSLPIIRGVQGISTKYQVGTFTTATTTKTQMGFSGGVILTTGDTKAVPLTLGTDPRSPGSMTGSYPSCTTNELRKGGTCAAANNIAKDINILSNNGTWYNAAILEFDFVPICDNFSFRYIFGSEEYTDGFTSYQCTDYNDVFGFLISGPGISGGQGFDNDAKNLGVLSNGSRVSINTVNNGVSAGDPSKCSSANPSWIANSPSSEYLGQIDGTNLNGNTKILTAKQTNLTPGQTYHIKFIITDLQDAGLDAVVYLETGSFTSPAISSTQKTIKNGVSSATSILTEGCTTGEMEITLNPTSASIFPLTYTVTGTATNGTDYTNLNGTTSIPANQASTILTINPTNDGTAETTAETVIITASTCGGTTSKTFSIVDPLQVTCISSTNSITFNWNNNGATQYNYSYSINSGAAVTGNTASGVTTYTVPSLTSGQSVTMTITPSFGTLGDGCTGTSTCSITGCSSPAISTQPVPRNICSGGNTTFTVASTGGNGQFQWQVSTGGSFTNITDVGVYSGSTTSTLTITGATISMNTYQYQCIVKESVGTCPTTTSAVALTVNAINTVTAASSTPTICINTAFTALTAITHTTTGATGIATTTTNYGLPAGVTATFSGNATSGTITINGTPTTAVGSPFNYSIPLSGGCGTVNATGTITVSPINTVTAASSTPTLCINTAFTALTAITHTTTGATGIATTSTNYGLPTGVTATFTGNAISGTITINGTPTTAVGSPFNYSIPLSGGCGTVNATGTITVSPINTVTAASSTPILCINTAFTALTAITHTTTGSTGIATTSTNYGLPTGVTATFTGNATSGTITINGTPTTAVGSPFNYSIPLSGGCGTVNATGTVTVTPNVTASVSITSSATNVCPGTTLDFTATPTNGGTTPIYQWQVNGNNDGTNSVTFSSSTLNDGDIVKVIMTSNANCVISSPATSNEITLTSGIVTASVSIIADNNPVCAGTNVTFTATPTNGGTNPTYQWKLNGSNIGTNNKIFSSTTLGNNDKITVEMTSNGGCVTGSPATSNEISMTITPNVNASVSIIEDKNSICAGTNVVFTATPTNGGTSPTYQWKLNGNNIGTGGNTFNSSTLSNNDIIKVIMTSNANCVIGSPATSNTITMIVNQAFTPSVTISSNNNICIGSPVTFTAVPQNGGSSPIYQWKLNNNNVGTGGTTFSSSSLANNDIVTVQMISNINCVISNPAISNSITMVISSPKAPLFLNIKSICENDIAPILNTTSLDNPPITGTWSPSIIDNKNSQNYTFTASTGCYSPLIMNVTVNKKPILVIGTTPSGCAPKKVDLTAPTLTAGSTIGSTFQYWVNASGTIPLSSPSSVGDGTYYISSTNNGCSSTPIAVPVVINPIPIADFTPSPFLVSTISPECRMINQSVGAVKYLWDFGDGAVSEENNPTHTFSDTDTASYIIKLIANSTLGCSDTIAKKVKVYEELIYFVPNTFTPDEDDFNNTFQPVFVSGYDPYSFTMTIFNRWGEMVFETHDSKIGWKGTYGKDSTEIAKEGVYTWKIEFSLKSDDRRKQITGLVNLLK